MQQIGILNTPELTLRRLTIWKIFLAIKFRSGFISQSFHYQDLKRKFYNF